MQVYLTSAPKVPEEITWVCPPHPLLDDLWQEIVWSFKLNLPDSENKTIHLLYAFWSFSFFSYLFHSCVLYSAGALTVGQLGYSYGITTTQS